MDTTNETIVIDASDVTTVPSTKPANKLGTLAKEWGPIILTGALGIAGFALKASSDLRKERKYGEYLDTKLDYTAEALGIDVHEVTLEEVETEHDVEDSSL